MLYDYGLLAGHQQRHSHLIAYVVLSWIHMYGDRVRILLGERRIRDVIPDLDLRDDAACGSSQLASPTNSCCNIPSLIYMGVMYGS